MGQIVKGIRVRDKNGMPFLVVERELVETIGGRERKNYRFELENGGVGTFVDYNTFVLIETGEVFSRANRAKWVWINRS